MSVNVTEIDVILSIDDNPTTLELWLDSVE
jgi:hypothetical protein